MSISISPVYASVCRDAVRDEGERNCLRMFSAPHALALRPKILSMREESEKKEERTQTRRKNSSKTETIGGENPKAKRKRSEGHYIPLCPYRERRRLDALSSGK